MKAMKAMKALTLLSALVLSTPAMSEEVNRMEACKELGEIAAKLMDLRQSDVPIDTVLSKLSEAHHPLIIHIYSSPRYETEKYIKRTINEAKTEAIIACISLIKD